MPRHLLTNLVWAALLLPGWAAAAELQPHSALYEIRLVRAAQSGRIEDAHGAVRIDWRESCTEWTVEQRFQLQLAMGDGTLSDSTTVYRSVESKDGRRYSFSSRTERDGELEEAYAGSVERATATAAATFRYEEPPGVALALPAGVAFPMQHQLALLEAAAKGGAQVDLPYFDGPRPADQPYEVNAILADRKRPAAEGTMKVRTAPFDRPWWPMQLAFFARNSRGATPDFEIGAEIQDNGVARMLRFDYGDLAISATAVAGETVARPAC